MAEVLEFFTEHADINGLLDFLAERVDDDGIMLTAAHSIPTGEWVRFSVRMVDGEVGFEGVGKCTGSAENESGVGFEVLLETLQFDARNEVMFERIQLAKETAETGEGTKPIDISNIAAERQREIARERARERAREQAATTRASKAPPRPSIPLSTSPSVAPEVAASVPTPSSSPPPPKVPRLSVPPKLAAAASLPKPATQIARVPVQAPLEATSEVDLASVEDVTSLDHSNAEIPLPNSIRPPLPSQRSAEAPAQPSPVAEPTPAPQAATIAGGASAPVEATPKAAASAPPPRNKIPYDVRQRLEKIVPTLRRRSIAFNEDEALALALRLGLATLEEMYSKR